MYRTIDTSLWTDPVTKKLPPLAKLLFVYLITNNHTHVSGIYYLPAVLVPHETGIDPDEADTLFDTLSSAGLVEKDADRELIWVKNMFKYQGAGEKNQRAAANHLGTLHNSPLVKEFLARYPEVRAFCTDRVSDTPSDFGTQNRNRNRNRYRIKEQKVPAAAQPGTVSSGNRNGSRKRPDGDHAKLIAFFCQGWLERFGNAYDFKGGKDGSAAKRILKACGDDLDRATRIISAYLDDDDQFISKKGHTLAMLSSEINGYLARGVNGSGNGEYLAPPREPDEADLALIRAGGDA
jgi:hypothetical protein